MVRRKVGEVSAGEQCTCVHFKRLALGLASFAFVEAKPRVHGRVVTADSSAVLPADPQATTALLATACGVRNQEHECGRLSYILNSFNFGGTRAALDIS